MQLLTEAVWRWFHGTYSDENVSVRVVLARMGERHVDDWAFYFPADKAPKSPPAAYRNDRTGYSRAKKSKELVIVEDVDRETRKGRRARFLSTEAKGDDYPGASLLCYPIRCPNKHDVPFVLSVYADRAKVFRRSQKDVYKFVLSTFSKRILIEYHLAMLQEEVQSEHNSTKANED